MKTEIHPEYVESHVTCTCGNDFMTRSTESEIHVDTGGRVDRFRRRAAKRDGVAKS